jgi:hypothetical protein
MEVDGATRNERLALLLLCILFLATRLPGLLALPLFNDEAVYLYRAQQFPAQLQFTIHDGKLLHELLLAALARLPWDPLLTGRLLSVVCGWLTIVGLWLSGRVIADHTAGVVASLLYIFSPLAIIHDRLAIPDAMLGSMASFLLAASLRLTVTPQPNRWHAAGIGALVALAALVKLPGLFLFALPALIIMTRTPSQDSHRRWALLRTALIITLLGITAFAPFNYGGAESQKVGVTNIVLQFERLAANIRHIVGWMAITLPLPTFALVGFGLIQQRTRRLVLTLAATAGLFCLALAAIGSTLYPRYILPSWPMLLLAAALGARQIPHSSRIMRGAAMIVATISAVWGFVFNLQYARDPAGAWLSAVDRRQYIESWSAGYNLPDVYAALCAAATEKGGIVVVSPVHERVIHFGPKIYLRDERLISFTDIDFRSADARALIRDIAARHPVFMTLDAQEIVAFDIEQRFPELKRIREWRNPHSTMAFYLYAWSP